MMSVVLTPVHLLSFLLFPPQLYFTTVVLGCNIFEKIERLGPNKLLVTGSSRVKVLFKKQTFFWFYIKVIEFPQYLTPSSFSHNKDRFAIGWHFNVVVWGAWIDTGQIGYK